MKKILFLSVTALTLSLGLYAQERSLTLRQCIDTAVRNNCGLKTSLLAVERARALQGTAWDLDRTDITLSQDPTSGGSPDNALSVTQGISFPTLYMARRRQLRAETQAERSRSDVTRATLIGDVTAAYCQLVYEVERQRILARQDSVLMRYHALADRRWQAGEARRLEVLTAERMLRENTVEMTAARSDAEAVRLRLSRLLGIEETVTPTDTVLMPLGGGPSAYDYRRSPEGILAHDRLTVADKAVAVAKNGFAPTLSVTLRSQLVLSSWDPYNVRRTRFDGGNFMGFEVGVGIPLFYGAAKARLKAARRERDMAEMTMRQERQTGEGEYLVLRNQCDAAYARVSYYDGEGMRQASETERLGTLEYENGEIDYVEYVSALRESIGVRMKRAEAVNAYNQSVVALRRLTGDLDF